MSPFGFYALRNAWLFSLLVPLVLFYFLKLKRPTVRVASLALWQRVLQDKRVNSPFQRFKRNILLFIQLLLLILLILAAMQPYFRGSEARIDKLPILIDHSASMAAVDAAGRSRLELARERVLQRIENLLPNQELCLISFAGSARKLTGFTNNKRILRDALEAIRVHDVPSDIEQALRIVQAVSRSHSFEHVLLLSDGNFPSWTGLQLSFDLTYERLPAAGPNAGIIALNAKRIDSETWDVFTKVAGSSEHESGASIELHQDGELLRSERLLVGESEERLVFRVTEARTSTLEVRLVPDGTDSLPQDNVAFLALPPGRELRAHVAESLGAYRHALQAIGGALLVDAPATSGDGNACDLIISDVVSDAYANVPVQLYVGVVPRELEGMIDVTQEGTELVDWERTCALLQYVQLRDVVILDQPVTAPGVDETHFENAGYEVLAHGRTGPLIVRKRAGARVAFYLLFHTDRSTLPYRLAFPIMVANALQLALRQVGLAEANAVRTGVLPAIACQPTVQCSIQPPDGVAFRRQTDADGILQGIHAPSVGCYTISPDTGEPIRMGASLLCEEETCLTTTDDIQFQESLSVTASAQRLKTEKPLWSTLGLLAFLAMLGEWWYYQRRAGG